MSDSRLEREKDELIQRLTEAYARSEMDMQTFERAVSRVSDSPDGLALEAELRGLGLALPVPVPAPSPSGLSLEPVSGAMELNCVSGSIRKVGDWVKAGSYAMRLQSSNARLDFGAYEGAHGLRLVIEVEARSSNLRLIVPPGFEVEDNFSQRISSVVRNRLRETPYGDNRIVLRGAIRSSTVRVKYRR
jgi:hypothetical protein